jgi:glycosyltransferase involved in cell wall biosynthesis
LRPLLDRLIHVLEPFKPCEIIFVNDGSTDGSAAVLESLHNEFVDIVRIIHLRNNCGKSVALQCGFKEVSGELIVMMDADLQDCPEEIPKLITLLEEKNLDAVTGWKFERRDPVYKTLPSRLFNFVLRKLSGLEVHDFNCGLKIIRAECLIGLQIYGQLHRFLLIFIHTLGFKIGEIKVKHMPRRYGYSKYGHKRLYEGLMDFMTVTFISKYLQSPLYFFGYYGMASLLLSVSVGGFYLGLHVISMFTDYPQWSLKENPLWLASLPFLFISMFFFALGLICELICYINKANLDEKYVRKRVGFDENGDKKQYKGD